ncbi:unnamed protein product [Caenorhabditis sp. 36 PRJEB53466]|nr:unnamed protein product [Caenorhabditis sp. 36 PRJEB53466]
MTSIYVWVRTVRSLQFFLPSLDADSDCFAVFLEICSEVIGMLPKADQISFDEFGALCNERIAENHLEAIFQNSVESGKGNARIRMLAYSLLFAGLQLRTKDLGTATHSEILLNRLSKYFGKFYAFSQISLPILQGYEFLDGLLEGTTKHRQGNSNQHGVRPLSHIIPSILEKANSISLPFLCNEIRRHLIRDPYHIDEFASEKSNSVFSTTRRTTLAHNSRRVVRFHYINKIEVLRKDEFANVHLRICNDKPKASFVFAPLRCETVFLESLTYCKWIVLGAVRGIVIVKNCVGTRISASCDQIIVMNSRNLEIHSMSLKKPIIHNSSSITFAPLNTIYEGQTSFLEENGHSFDNNLILKEPINFGETSWKLMDTSRFVCQRTPLHSTDKNSETLTASLPELYRLAHYRNTAEGRKWLSDNNRRTNDVVSHSDLLYLKSKIEKRQEEEGEAFE